MKILNFGSCNIDYVYSLDHIVAVGETETSDKLEIFPGGKGLNQSIAAARAGAKVYHAGCVGEDGGLLTDVLSNSGVDLTYLKKIDGKSGHAIIQLSHKGANSIFLYPGANEAMTKEYIDEVLSHFEKGDILCLQNEINLVDYLVDKAYDKGMRIILNPSPFNEKLDKVDYGKLSFVILNEVEGSAIAGGGNDPAGILANIKAKYPRLEIVLTLGAKGCVYTDGEREIYHAAFDAPVIDTTAAGDTFTGYFMAELARGKDYPEILKIASAASALAISKKGAAPSIPLLADVQKAANTLPLCE